MLVIGIDIGHDLARVVFVGQPVDNRYARGGREAFNDALLEGANHDDVAHARDDLRRVFDGFTATELRIARIQINSGATQLLHAGLERQTCARTGLFEDHD